MKEYNTLYERMENMKKIVISVIIVFLIVFGIFIFKKDDSTDTNLTKITLAEVTHSIFYAPQYVAISEGYFEEEGIDIELILASGADAVTAAVLSGDVQIGFCGTEATIYVYNGGEKDYLQTFAGLTQKDGSFLVSREKYEDFTLEDLKGKYVIGGRKGGMPEMTLEWALRENGIDPKKDLNIDTSIEFASMAGAFIGGTGDYVTLFEPQALQLEKEGVGYVVASVGELGGVVPYTTYNAKKSYIEKNPDVIEGYTRAIQRGLDYVHSHSDEEVAKVILDEFPDTSLEDLTKIVKRYRDIDAWFKTTEIKKEDFDHIQEIVSSAGELDKKVPYNKIFTNAYAK